MILRRSIKVDGLFSETVSLKQTASEKCFLKFWSVATRRLLKHVSQKRTAPGFSRFSEDNAANGRKKRQDRVTKSRRSHFENALILLSLRSRKGRFSNISMLFLVSKQETTWSLPILTSVATSRKGSIFRRFFAAGLCRQGRKNFKVYFRTMQTTIRHKIVELSAVSDFQSVFLMIRSQPCPIASSP